MEALKRLTLFIAFMFALSVGVKAQGKGGFNPARFEAELEHFITVEARLSPKEAAAFFPVYKEMRKKQMAYFSQDRFLRYVDVNDDKACAEALSKHDENDIAMKELQQEYHRKFLKILSPSKAFMVVRAEEKFHRQLFQQGKPKDKKTRK
jgi:hypothetical protein